LKEAFAFYHIKPRRGNQIFLGISKTQLILKHGNKTFHLPLSSIIFIDTTHRKKLMPLVSGGIIASLAMLASVLSTLTLNLITILAGGLLLFYYGLTNYLVLQIHWTEGQQNLWISVTHSNRLNNFIRLIKGYLISNQPPILYAHHHAGGSGLTHHSAQPVLSGEPIVFNWQPDRSTQDISIYPHLLDAPIDFSTPGQGIATSQYLINENARVE